MKKFALFVAAALSPVALVNVAHADAALAQAKGCTACHQVDKKCRPGLQRRGCLLRR